MRIKRCKKCRVCDSPHLTRVIDLGKQYLQGAFLKKGMPKPPMRKFPTSLVWCDVAKNKRACGLLQMEYSVPPQRLYTAYWYRSGTTNTMRKHLCNIAQDAVYLYGRNKTRVLDIGCNDGTLLKFYPDTFEKFGIDPSNIAGEALGNFTIVRDFFPSDKLKKMLGDKMCGIITSIAMFYDLENPVLLVKAAKDILSPEGIWILETAYMPEMLKTNSYDTICHEHLEYYSLTVLERILNKAGMKIFAAALNDINGGSIRCYATHRDTTKYDTLKNAQGVKELRRCESRLGLTTSRPYKAFQKRADAHGRKLHALLKRLKAYGKTIHASGASPKGNTILQWCGIDKRIIDVAAERSPDKCGARTIGTGIPIVSEAESRAMKPDYYLVLPWHFKKEIIERERKTLQNGIRFIFPLPKIEIVESGKKQFFR